MQVARSSTSRIECFPLETNGAMNGSDCWTWFYLRLVFKRIHPAGLEPARPRAADFKSAASTNSAKDALEKGCPGRRN